MHNLQQKAKSAEEAKQEQVGDVIFSEDAELEELGQPTKNQKGDQFKAPLGLNAIFNFLPGIKINIKNIHVRYEDDIFAKQQLAIGLRIEQIDLTTKKSHWEFQTQTGCQFKRVENKFINKEFSICNLGIYLEEGVLIPTTLFENTRYEKYEIFSVIDPEAVKEYMNQKFDQDITPDIHGKVCVNKNNILNPMFVNIAINLNTCYVPDFVK